MDAEVVASADAAYVAAAVAMRKKNYYWNDYLVPPSSYHVGDGVGRRTEAVVVDCCCRRRCYYCCFSHTAVECWWWLMDLAGEGQWWRCLRRKSLIEAVVPWLLDYWGVPSDWSTCKMRRLSSGVLCDEWLVGKRGYWLSIVV